VQISAAYFLPAWLMCRRMMGPRVASPNTGEEDGSPAIFMPRPYILGFAGARNLDRNRSIGRQKRVYLAARRLLGAWGSSDVRPFFGRTGFWVGGWRTRARSLACGRGAGNL